MVGYNPNMDLSFMTPEMGMGVFIGFIIQTVFLFTVCQCSMAMLMFSCFLLLVTMWIYIVITMFLCAIIEGLNLRLNISCDTFNAYMSNKFHIKTYMILMVISTVMSGIAMATSPPLQASIGLYIVVMLFVVGLLAGVNLGITVIIHILIDLMNKIKGRF